MVHSHWLLVFPYALCCIRYILHLCHHWCPGLLVCGGRIVVADALVVDVCHDLGPCRVRLDGWLDMARLDIGNMDKFGRERES